MMMRRQLVSAAMAFAAILTPLAARADLSGNEYPHTLPYKLYAGGASTALQVSAFPVELTAIINTNTAAQTATFTCYDNASAASGQVLWSGILGASQVVTLPGEQSLNGIECISSAATLSGNGILILSR